jgi:hypothetical protein
MTGSWGPPMKPVVVVLIAWPKCDAVWGYDAGRPDRARGPPEALWQLGTAIASPKGTAS